MIFIMFMKAAREICTETMELRRALAKRYPFVRHD